MIVQERGQIIATYEGYTAFYRTEIYTGKIYGVVMYKQETLPEMQTEVQAAAVLVAQIQAQGLTDEQALQCKAIYPEWKDIIGQTVKQDYKFLHGDVLYKVIQPGELTIQEQKVCIQCWMRRMLERWKTRSPMRAIWRLKTESITVRTVQSICATEIQKSLSIRI